MQSTLADDITTIPLDHASEAHDYSELLNRFDIPFHSHENHWTVGQPAKTHGWIIHLSAIISQVEKMLTTILPVLYSRKIPFKIIRNGSLADDIVNGNLGVVLLGKVVTIYPDNDEMAVDIASELIELTVKFKGPTILTDFCLGNIVYTRHGAFKPVIKVNPFGQEENYFYDNNAVLIKDNYQIPFRFPERVHWPFAKIAKPVLPKPPEFLNKLYKPTDLLKADPRGNVFKGLFVKGFLRVKTALIKQGFQNMASDNLGRDIRDRLKWQFELHKALENVIPLPKVYGLIEEKEHSILMLEWIKGISLYQKIAELNPASSCWQDLPDTTKSQLLQYCAQIIDILRQMHRLGYVHRDVVPVNFMIDQKDRVRPIDIELAYSIHQSTPLPPFALGTYGFMSPEQVAKLQPTVAEDIYGLGATLIYLFTGMLPIKFTDGESTNIFESLAFFTQSQELASVLSRTQSKEPHLRPSLNEVDIVFNNYTQAIKSNSKPAGERKTTPSNKYEFRDLILRALDGLTKPPIPIKHDVWFSRRLTPGSSPEREIKQFSISPGFAEGLSGMLYTLATLKQANINIDSCEPQIYAASKFLIQRQYPSLSDLTPGLFYGTAGLAWGVHECLHSGKMVKEDIHHHALSECFNLSTDKADLATGIAGVGLSLVHCRKSLDTTFYKEKLVAIISLILSRQIQEGVWLARPTQDPNAMPVPDLYWDNTGVIWFLLAAINEQHSPQIEETIKRGLSNILTDKRYMQQLLSFIGQRSSFEVGDGGKGLIALLIYAYSTFGDNDYKACAVKLLAAIPPKPVHNNLDFYCGLSALGELYLEAWRVFRETEWKSRADWIADVLKYSFLKSTDGSGYWKMDQNNVPTAALLNGNCGVIHFLARNTYQEGLSHCFLP